MDDVANSEALLNSNEAIKQSLTPFGRKLGIVMDDQYGLFRVTYVDGKNGEVPTVLSGKWTSLASCRIALDGYLKQVWAFSDSQQKKPLTYAKTKSNTIISTS